MRASSIHHVSINVSDAEACTTFYTDVLGGDLRSDRPDFAIGGAWIDFGATQVHLIEAEVPPNHGQHFALAVDDLDAAIAELRGAGVRVGDPAAVGTARQAFLTDPSGNSVELHEPAR